MSTSSSRAHEKWAVWRAISGLELLEKIQAVVSGWGRLLRGYGPVDAPTPQQEE